MSTANLVWFKSSYSAGNGGQCIGVALDWRKSSYSGSQGGACIEVATSPAAIHVRDSKDPQGPSLAFSPTEWSAFLRLAVEVVNP